MSSLHGSFRQSLASVGFRCAVLRIPKDSRPIALLAHVRHGAVTGAERRLCQVVHVGSLRRVAVAAPRPPNISTQPARRAVRESLVTNRGPSLTLVTIPSRNSHRRVVTSRTLNPATHNLPTASSACRWRVPPLGTAVWRRPTLPHGRGHLGRPCHAAHTAGSSLGGGASVVPTPRRERNELKAGLGSAFVSPSASTSVPGA